MESFPHLMSPSGRLRVPVGTSTAKSRMLSRANAAHTTQSGPDSGLGLRIPAPAFVARIGTQQPANVRIWP